MKFAIPTNDDKGLDSKLTAIYSKSKFFLLVNVDDNKVGAYEPIPNEVPANVEGVMGAVAFMLAGKGVEAAIKQYLDGKLTESSECKSGKNVSICEC